jgi:hypothetical protein
MSIHVSLAHGAEKCRKGEDIIVKFALDEKIPKEYGGLGGGFIQAEAGNEVDAVRDRTTPRRSRYPPTYRSLRRRRYPPINSCLALRLLHQVTAW